MPTKKMTEERWIQLCDSYYSTGNWFRDEQEEIMRYIENLRVLHAEVLKDLHIGDGNMSSGTARAARLIYEKNT